jgi:hypothetical protein
MFFSTKEETFLAEVQCIITASSATSRERLWPFIEQVERKYILPLLEKELYEDLQKFYGDHDNWQSGSGEGDEAKTSELLKLIQIAEINLAYFVGFDLLNVVASDAGFQKPGEQGAYKGLYKYQEENLRKYFEITGYNGLDDMLKFIEDNIEHFPEFEDSVNYSQRKSAIIRDAETFDSICFINKSRLTFLRLQRFMTEVIDFDIKPLLGAEYATLISELAKDDPDEKYAALAIEIRKPLAFLSCAKLIDKTGNLTDRGLFFEGKQAGFPDDSYKNPVTGDAAVIAASSYNSSGQKYLDLLRKYLIDNSFTDIGSTNGSIYNRNNDHKKTFVA